MKKEKEVMPSSVKSAQVGADAQGKGNQGKLHYFKSY